VALVRKSEVDHDAALSREGTHPTTCLVTRINTFLVPQRKLSVRQPRSKGVLHNYAKSLGHRPSQTPLGTGLA